MEAYKLFTSLKELDIPKASSFNARYSPKKGVYNSIKRVIGRSAWNATKSILLPKPQVMNKKELKKKEVKKLLKGANIADKLIFNNNKNIDILLSVAPKDYNLSKFKSTPYNKIFALELFKKAKILEYYNGQDDNIIKIQALLRGFRVRNKNILDNKKKEVMIQNLFKNTMRKHRESMGKSGRNTPRFNSSGSRHSNSSRISDRELLFNTSRNKSLASNASSSRYYSANSRLNSYLSNKIGRKTHSELLKKKQSLERRERATV